MGAACSTDSKQKKSVESSKLKAMKSLRSFKSFGKRKKEAASDQFLKPSLGKCDSGDLRLSFTCQFFPMMSPGKSGGDAKNGSFLGKASIPGLERAVEILDALGSGVTNLNTSGFLSSSFTVRGFRISVLAFEVANTIVRVANLLHSVSVENTLRVKQELFLSDGVQRLVSTDTNVLLSIAAEDKSEELYVLCCEVARFGNLCKDPQWHNLDRVFAKLRLDAEDAAAVPLREEAGFKLHELTNLAQHTAELYHELNALERFEHDYQQCREEAESLNILNNLGGKRERKLRNSLMILQTELKHQKRLVLSLKRKSLWSRRMEEVMETLVDIVSFTHQKIPQVYGNAGVGEVCKEANKAPERLGPAGLALHYASIVHQIDNIATRPSCLPPNTRDSLYHGLPISVKNALRSSLRRSSSKQELSITQIKAEMERILEWLVPVATSTSKMYQGFGWVGEWANTSGNTHRKQTSMGTTIRLQTLYHADKQKTDLCILELVERLHHLIAAAKQRDYAIAKPMTLTPKGRSMYNNGGSSNTTTFSSEMYTIDLSHQKFPPKPSAPTGHPSPIQKVVEVELDDEDKTLLEAVSQVQSLPILSRSQRFSISLNRRSFKMPWACRSSGSSPCGGPSRGAVEVHDDGCDLRVLNSLDLAY